MASMRLHGLWKMGPVHRRNDMEPGVLRIIAANHARIPIFLAIELVISSIFNVCSVRFECQLDDQFIFSLLDAIS